MDCSLPLSSLHGISQARRVEWVAISFSRELSPTRDQTCDKEKTETGWISLDTKRCTGSIHPKGATRCQGNERRREEPKGLTWYPISLMPWYLILVSLMRISLTLLSLAVTCQAMCSILKLILCFRCHCPYQQPFDPTTVLYVSVGGFHPCSWKRCSWYTVKTTIKKHFSEPNV